MGGLLVQQYPSPCAFLLFYPRLEVMELCAMEVALWLSPGVGVSMAVPVRMTLMGKRWGNGNTRGLLAAREVAFLC